MNPPVHSPWKEGSQQLSAGALHYVERPGPGPTLLLLHGVTRCGRDWESFVPELSPEWRIIALDHRGHGGSARTPGGYRVVDYARHAAEFVRATTNGPLVVFGHSLGAMIALHLAAECADLVAGAALEDPPFHTMGRDIGSTTYRAQFAGMQVVARRGGDVETLTDGLAEIRLPGPEDEIRLGDTRERAALRFSAECLALLDPEIFTPLIAGEWLDGFDYNSLWPRVRCPLLLLQGDPRHGGALCNKDADLAERTLPQCRRVCFQGVGHQIHSTQPAHAAAVLQHWARDFALLT